MSQRDRTIGIGVKGWMSIWMLGMAMPLFASAQSEGAATEPTYDTADPMPALEFMDRDEEVAMARAAGPAVVADHATVWVIGPEGYEIAVEGSNGWGCMVQRNATGSGFFPRCDDPAGVATAFETYFLFERVRAAGGSVEDFREELAQGIESGAFSYAPVGSVSYMYADGPIPPHVMFSRPDCDEGTIGLMSADDATADGLGVSLLGRGSASCYVVIFTPEETRRSVSGGG